MRLINADALDPSEVYMDYGFTRIVYMDDIDEMPTIEAEPVRHGRWEVNNTYGYMDMTCSVCGWLYEYYLGLEDEWNFCPHCGAKMDVVNE